MSGWPLNSVWAGCSHAVISSPSRALPAVPWRGPFSSHALKSPIRQPFLVTSPLLLLVQLSCRGPSLYTPLQTLQIPLPLFIRFPSLNWVAKLEWEGRKTRPIGCTVRSWPRASSGKTAWHPRDFALYLPHLLSPSAPGFLSPSPCSWWFHLLFHWGEKYQRNTLQILCRRISINRLAWQPHSVFGPVTVDGSCFPSSKACHLLKGHLPAAFFSLLSIMILPTYWVVLVSMRTSSNQWQATAPATLFVTLYSQSALWTLAPISCLLFFP